MGSDPDPILADKEIPVQWKIFLSSQSRFKIGWKKVSGHFDRPFLGADLQDLVMKNRTFAFQAQILPDNEAPGEIRFLVLKSKLGQLPPMYPPNMLFPGLGYRAWETWGNPDLLRQTETPPHDLYITGFTLASIHEDSRLLDFFRPKIRVSFRITA